MVKAKNVVISANDTEDPQCKKPFEEPEGMIDIDLREIISSHSHAGTSKNTTKCQKITSLKLLFAGAVGLITIACFALTLLLTEDAGFTWTRSANFISKQNKTFPNNRTINKLHTLTKTNSFMKYGNITQNHILIFFKQPQKIKRDILHHNTQQNLDYENTDSQYMHNSKKLTEKQQQLENTTAHTFSFATIASTEDSFVSGSETSGLLENIRQAEPENTHVTNTLSQTVNSRENNDSSDSPQQYDYNDEVEPETSEDQQFINGLSNQNVVEYKEENFMNIQTVKQHSLEENEFLDRSSPTTFTNPNDNFPHLQQSNPYYDEEEQETSEIKQFSSELPSVENVGDHELEDDVNMEGVKHHLEENEFPDRSTPSTFSNPNDNFARFQQSNSYNDEEERETSKIEQFSSELPSIKNVGDHELEDDVNMKSVKQHHLEENDFSDRFTPPTFTNPKDNFAHLQQSNPYNDEEERETFENEQFLSELSSFQNVADHELEDAVNMEPIKQYHLDENEFLDRSTLSTFTNPNDKFAHLQESTFYNDGTKQATTQNYIFSSEITSTTNDLNVVTKELYNPGLGPDKFIPAMFTEANENVVHLQETDHDLNVVTEELYNQGMGPDKFILAMSTEVNENVVHLQETDYYNEGLAQWTIKNNELSSEIPVSTDTYTNEKHYGTNESGLFHSSTLATYTSSNNHLSDLQLKNYFIEELEQELAENDKLINEIGTTSITPKNDDLENYQEQIDLNEQETTQQDNSKANEINRKNDQKKAKHLLAQLNFPSLFRPNRKINSLNNTSVVKKNVPISKENMNFNNEYISTIPLTDATYITRRLKSTSVLPFQFNLLDNNFRIFDENTNTKNRFQIEKPETDEIYMTESATTISDFSHKERWSEQDPGSFVNIKSAAKEFAGVNEHLQTNQQSTVSQNFGRSSCPTFVSPMGFSILQQTNAFPYLYNSNPAISYANMMPYPVSRSQSNAFVPQQYPYMGTNLAMSYANKGISQQGGYFLYNLNGQNMLSPSLGDQYGTQYGGQYYICNPVSNIVSTMNTNGVSEVEIRQSTGDSNLQQSYAGDSLENKARASRNCPFGERSCEDDSKCIKLHHFCDGDVHCKDASDEAFCPCKFRINKSRLCDGYIDCPKGEDEFKCFGCAGDGFSCDDWTPRDRTATCIPIEQRCDGVPQCPTGKDEQDCSVLADTLSDKHHFMVSATIGFLYRNFKGRWYPACRNPELWAIDACQSESGRSTIAPLTHLVPIDVNYNGLYASSSAKDTTKITHSCEAGAAIFVECPPLVCGMRIKFKNPYRLDEVDTSAEVILAQFENESVEADNVTEDSILGVSRVVGGKPSQPEAWPWVISVYRNGVFHCGGVLINELWIVTAAHCVDKYSHYYYEIQAGVLRRYSYAPMVQNRVVSHIIAHQAYDRTQLKNDLALMKMSKPLKFNRYVKPICLPSEVTAGQNFMWGPEPGTICTAVGWGATVEHGSDPDHLREVEVPVLKHCKHREDEEGHEICAGLMEGGKDACQGDSGGPFMCRNPNVPNQWYLAGIVSHGEGCARPNEPGVYTRVSLFLEWIFENIRSQILPQTTPLHHCPGYICQKTSKCIANKRRCNKIVDCMLGDDELQCERRAFNGIFKHAMRHMFFRSQEDLENTTTSETHMDESSISATTKTTLSSKQDLENLTNFDLTPSKIYEEQSTIAEVDLLTMHTSNTPMAEPKPTTEIPSTTHMLITTPFKSLVTTKSYIGRFKCKRLLQTIDISKKCDRNADCEDATDEESCLCVDYLRNSNSEVICDGITDCSDLSDEMNCHVCKENEYHCRQSNVCITKEMRCNSIPDCPMEEDELDCFALTNGRTVTLDGDSRPHLNISGVVTFNHNGTWRVVCSNWTGTEATFAADICFYLGFSDYKSFLKISVYDNPLQVNNATVTLKNNIFSKSDKCTTIFIKCSDIIDTKHHIEYENISKTFADTSWNAEIYLNGIFACTGTVLDTQWIITSFDCFGGNLHLSYSYVTVLLGRAKGYLSVASPHEQIVRVTEALQVANTSIILLRLGNNINFSRYIRPIRFNVRDYSVSEKETCIAIGRNFKNMTESISLKAISNCTVGFRCFKRINPEDKFCNSKIFNKNWSGCIVCRSKHGWYPAAVFQEPKGSCGFTTTASFTSVQFWKANIIKLMKQATFTVESPLCTGFRCNLGQCIEKHKLCDGIPSCHDAADEDLNYCTEVKKQCSNSSSCVCLKSELKCLNGQCVPKEAFCNGNNDCGDWSDEPNTCNCRSYLALTHPEKVCDGIRNCFDRTDEDPRICKCKGYHFLCRQSNYCVTREVVCDGVPDCPNGEDEVQCLALTSVAGLPNEVQVRTAGVWHPGCFPKSPTTLQLENICLKMGYSGGSAIRITSVNDLLRKNSWRPVTEPFQGVWISRAKNLMIGLRAGDKPFVTLQPNSTCYRLFLQCL